MAEYAQTTVDDERFGLTVVVDDGDDLIDLIGTAEIGTAGECQTQVRLTIDETLATIAALTEAVRVALQNRSAE